MPRETNVKGFIFCPVCSTIAIIWNSYLFMFKKLFLFRWTYSGWRLLIKINIILFIRNIFFFAIVISYQKKKKQKQKQKQHNTSTAACNLCFNVLKNKATRPSFSVFVTAVKIIEKSKIFQYFAFCFVLQACYGTDLIKNITY